MKAINVQNYTVEDISQQLTSHAINSFIVFDVNKQIPNQIFEYPHSLDGIVFSVCTEGTARFKMNMQEYNLCPNMTVTVLPNSIIEPIEVSNDFLLKTLFFSYDFISDFPLPPDFNIFDIIEHNPCLHVTDDEYLNLLKYYDFIKEQYGKKDHCYRKEIDKLLLFALIAEIGSLYSTKQHLYKLTQKEMLIRKFFALLRKHYIKERHISFYANELCLSPKYLTSTIKKITGKPILAWIHETIVAYAKVQLKSPHKTVSQISEDLNFSDLSIFCRLFKKHTGMTPLQYRESRVNIFTANIAVSSHDK